MGHDLSSDKDTNLETWHAQEIPQSEETLRTAWEKLGEAIAAEASRRREADARYESLQEEFSYLSRAHADQQKHLEQERAANAKAEQEREWFVEKHRRDSSQIAELEAEIPRLTQAHAARETQLEQQVEQLRQEIEREREKHLNAQYNDSMRIAELTGEIANRTQAHEQRLKQLEQEHNAKHERNRAELVSNHDHETKHLATQVGELNAALLKRDSDMYVATIFGTAHLPQRTDAPLKESLAAIARAVDNLGRLRWRNGQNIWPEETLSRLSAVHSHRILQKAILQDLIWFHLFKHVYASPFRVFGAEGSVLEIEWYRNTATDPMTTDGAYTWPPASAQAERWRYFTLNGCKQVLIQSLVQYDPRVALKKGFAENQNELIANLRATISTFAELDEEKTLQRIRHLAKDAMRMWLDMSMHRPRLVVELTGASFTKLEDRIVEIQRGSVELVLQPRLIRYGNSIGGELNNSTILSPGETLKLQ